MFAVPMLRFCAGRPARHPVGTYGAGGQGIALHAEGPRGEESFGRAARRRGRKRPHPPREERLRP